MTVWKSNSLIFFQRASTNSPIEKGLPNGFLTLTLYSLCWTAALLEAENKQTNKQENPDIGYCGICKGQRTLFCRKNSPVIECHPPSLMSWVQPSPWAPMTLVLTSGMYFHTSKGFLWPGQLCLHKMGAAPESKMTQAGGVPNYISTASPYMYRVETMGKKTNRQKTKQNRTSESRGVSFNPSYIASKMSWCLPRWSCQLIFSSLSFCIYETMK